MKTILTLAGIILAAIVINSTVIQANTFEAKVRKISDGDTITVLHDRQYTKIRLAGIDCPEMRQPWGKRAKKAISAMVAANATVTIKVMDKDQYGRTVGRVFLNGQNINQQLVKEGHCWVYPRYAKDKTLFSLQEEAKQSQRGLWSLPASKQTPPWLWRRKNG